MWLAFEKCGSISNWPYFFSADTFMADFPAELSFQNIFARVYNLQSLANLW